MPSVHGFWSLGLSGTTQTSHDPQFLGVLNMIIRRKLVFRKIESGTMTYGYPIKEARTSIVLPPAFFQLPVDSHVYIEYVLACLGVDRPEPVLLRNADLRAARGLSSPYDGDSRLDDLRNLGSGGFGYA
ncbi:hypothetical protein NL676_012178 [Syzygium grande]|nr:hypothetical protein NL676_012178 [Syzygium grande]